ncbi:MAG: hypothetical protein VX715_04680 [Planctomycetota bacterium]|nr:hypothetical protein [Planctomycetota bacterium]
MKRTTSGQILLLAASCFLGGCQRPVEQAPGGSQALLAVFGNQQVIETVWAASEVHAYRLADASFYQDDVSSYERSGEAVTLSEADRLQLRDLLLDEESYELEMAKGCEPVFGVGVTFARGEQRVDVLFCFECDILAVYQDGKGVGDEDFDPARTRLVKLVKKFFPADDVIQQLK